MRNLTVNKTTKIKIKCEMSADQWELYSIPGRNQVAKRLNSGMNRAVNTSKDWNEAYEKGEKMLFKFSDHGAADSEGISMLVNILNEAFGEPQDW